jgi:hypothetical protein
VLLLLFLAALLTSYPTRGKMTLLLLRRLAGVVVDVAIVIVVAVAVVIIWNVHS